MVLVNNLKTYKRSYPRPFNPFLNKIILQLCGAYFVQLNSFLQNFHNFDFKKRRYNWIEYVQNTLFLDILLLLIISFPLKLMVVALKDFLGLWICILLKHL